MLILSHRGNGAGPGTLDLEECRDKGWGIELDLRFDDQWQCWYFNHDRVGYSSETDACHLLYLTHNCVRAINIKEVGHEEEAVKLLQYHHRTFVFDFELCGADPKAYEKLTRAARVSDRRDEQTPQFEAPIIWLDEFNVWATKKDVVRLASKKVYWVSPELHMSDMPITPIKRRWRDAIGWGVDGICTDYPEELEKLLQKPLSQEERWSQLSEAPIG